MPYRSFKDLPRRTVADKVLRDNAFNIAKNPRYDGYQKDLASMLKRLRLTLLQMKSYKIRN